MLRLERKKERKKERKIGRKKGRKKRQTCYVYPVMYTQEIFPATYRCADKFLARPGRKQATATEDFEFHIS